MRIDDRQIVAPSAGTEKRALSSTEPHTSQEPAQPDRTELSGVLAELAAAGTERVEKLRSEFESGAYSRPADEVAARLIDEHVQNRGDQ
jgi:anti-sigma28 factor (negative regulator of flagellin synthesis)